MRSHKLFLFGLLTIGLCFQQAAAQTKPYLVSASIYLAADDQVDIWLNGTHVAYYPHTPKATGFKTFSAKPDSLCYFKTDNLLAIQVVSAKKASTDNYVGVAYVVRLKLSDGTVQTISSSAADEHRSLYIPHRGSEEPIDWQSFDFDDSAWAHAQTSTNTIPGIAALTGTNFGGNASFLTATTGYTSQFPGEKHLFRRRFHLDIATNPRCLPGYVTPKPKAKKFLGSITPVVVPAKKMPLASPPLLSKPAVRVVQPKLPEVTIVPTWTPTATLPPVALIPTMTETPTITATVMADTPTVTAESSPVPTPQFAPTVVVQDDGAVVFNVGSPANVLVTFGDGPGNYQVDVVDENLHHLKTLLYQHVLSSSEMWLTWDGKDDLGRDVKLGQYYILCSKEAVVIQKIILRKVATLDSK